MNDALLKKLFDWTPSFRFGDFSIESRSSYHHISDGFCTTAPFFPEMLLINRDAVISKIEHALLSSEQAGADIAALGAFTSIADGNQGAIVSRVACSMAVTNGSTYTSAMTIEGIKKICKIMGMCLEETNLAIIGATGSIGRTCSRYFMGKTQKLTLTGRKIEKLNHLYAGYLDKYRNIRLTTDNNAAVSDADCVISVTSSVESIFQPDAFKSGTIICDVGFPKNISAVCNSRDDIIVYSGGYVQIPGEIKDAVILGLPSNAILYGCLSEGILLSLEHRYDLCMASLDDIPLENVEYMARIGDEHGFTVAPFSNDYKQYTEQDFDRIKRVREKRLEATDTIDVGGGTYARL